MYFFILKEEKKNDNKKLFDKLKRFYKFYLGKEKEKESKLKFL